LHTSFVGSRFQSNISAFFKFSATPAKAGAMLLTHAIAAGLAPAFAGVTVLYNENRSLNLQLGKAKPADGEIWGLAWWSGRVLA
jgi:hypothetical protein